MKLVKYKNSTKDFQCVDEKSIFTGDLIYKSDLVGKVHCAKCHKDLTSKLTNTPVVFVFCDCGGENL